MFQIHKRLTKGLITKLTIAGMVALSLGFASMNTANATSIVEEEESVKADIMTEVVEEATESAIAGTHDENHHGEEGDHGGGHGEFGVLFLFLAILLISAKIGGAIEKAGQPAVLGELLAGIGLSILAYMGFGMIEELRHNDTIAFLAEVGAVILLFQIGLESNIKQLMSVGVNALIVAIIGVAAPFAAGTFLIGPWFFPDASFVAHLFMGASMVATSVGITASVFKTLKILKTRAAQTVLGAAVIDDVLGLIVLAVVSAMAAGGDVTPAFVARLSAEAIGFLGAAIVLGSLLAKPVSLFFSQINTGTGMKIAIPITFALVFAYLASMVGLAPIVGAFAAGLILDAVHFETYQLPHISHALKELRVKRKDNVEKVKKIVAHANHAHIEDMIENIAFIFVPMFFAFTGLQIEIESLMDPSVYVIALMASAIAILGKLVAGLGAKGDLKEKLIVGMSMVPRGEVGLIFASIGKALGAINDQEFSVIILVVIITTFIAPPALKYLGQRTTLK